MRRRPAARRSGDGPRPGPRARRTRAHRTRRPACPGPPSRRRRAPRSPDGAERRWQAAARGPAERTRRPVVRGGPAVARGPGGPAAPADRRRRPRRRGQRQERRATRGGSGSPSWKIVVASFVGLAAGVFGMIAVAYANTPVPTRATSRHRRRRPGQRHLLPRRQDLSPGSAPSATSSRSTRSRSTVQDAVIAAENAASARTPASPSAAWCGRSGAPSTGEQVQGASTITQQMARNYYDGLSQERSSSGRSRRSSSRSSSTRSWTKRQILEQYLNTIYFGRGAYGIEAAARRSSTSTSRSSPRRRAPTWPAASRTPTRSTRPRRRARLAPTAGALRLRDQGQWPCSTPQVRRAGREDAHGAQRIPKSKPTGLLPGPGHERLHGRRGAAGARGARHLQRGRRSKGGYKITRPSTRSSCAAAKKAVVHHVGQPQGDPRQARGRRSEATAGCWPSTAATTTLKDAWNDAFDCPQKQAASAFKPYVLAAWLDAGTACDSYVPRQEARYKLPGTTPIGSTGPQSMGAIDLDVVADRQLRQHGLRRRWARRSGWTRSIEIAAKAAGSARPGAREDDVDGATRLPDRPSAVPGDRRGAGGAATRSSPTRGKHIDYHVVVQVKDR